MKKLNNIETEVKLLDVDRDKLFNRLSELGIGVRQKDQEDFVVIINKGEYIRVRKEGEKTILTYKKKIEDPKYAKYTEHELEISDANTMKEILRNLFRGKLYLDIKKKRWMFLVDGVKGEYVEINDKVRYVELEGDEKEIEKAIELLGLQPYKRTTEPLDIILDKAGVTFRELY